MLKGCRWIAGFLVLLISGSRISGQVPTPPASETEPYTYERMAVSVRFENDGTGSVSSSVRVKVHTERGLQSAGQIVVPYNSETEQLEIQFVHVIKPDGRTLTAGIDAVQDLSSPVSQQAPVYSDIRQKHITVPGLSVGDTLEYATNLVMFKGITPGQFWYTWDFDRDAACADEELTLNVPKDRPLRIKSPTDVPSVVREEGDRRTYHWTASSPKPVPVLPPSDFDVARFLGAVPPHPTRRVLLSTFLTWEAVGNWYTELERDRRQPSQEIRAKSADLTKGATSSVEKAQAIYSYVARNIRYVSLSFGIGHYQPHSAAEVLANQYGDCKDKTTLLNALLTAAGVQSATALINSTAEVDPDVPSPQQFDHAISLLTENNHDIWMDSTAAVGPFGYLLPQLRSKNALVVFSDRPAAIRKTVQFPVETSYNVAMDLVMKESGMDGHITFDLRGDAEVLLRSLFLLLPPATLKEMLTAQAKNANTLQASIVDIKAGDPLDLGTPFRIEAQISSTASSSNGTADASNPFAGLPLDSLLPDIETKQLESGQPVDLGTPKDIKLQLKLTLPTAIGTTPPVNPVHLTKDFAEFETAAKIDGRTTTLNWHFQLFKSQIPRTEVKEFADFRDQVLKSLTPAEPSKPATRADLAPTASAVEFHQAGMAAFNRRDFKTARTLLETAVQKNPRYEAAWNNLGRCYLDLSLLKEAGDAFQKAIDLNPNEPYAYNNLGLVFWRQKQYDNAIAMFEKQSDVNPDEPNAHSNLGQLYFEQSKDELAVQHLELAAVITPKSAKVQEFLGRTYLRLSQPDKAIEAFDKALEFAPGAATSNNISYYLADANVHLDRAETLSNSAVRSVADQLRTVSVNSVKQNDLAQTQSLVRDWDTLGWVKFQKGDLDAAEKYLHSAWMLTDSGVTADHLAQVYEKQGRRTLAIDTYAAALASSSDLPDARMRLAALLGASVRVDPAVSLARGQVAAKRSIKFKNSLKEKGSAEFWVALVPGPRVRGVQFISGDEKLRPLTNMIESSSFPDPFPDSLDTLILRRGIVVCPTITPECQLVFIPSEAAQVEN